MTLVSLVRPGDSPEAVAHLRQWCEAVIPVPIERSRVRDALDELFDGWDGVADTLTVTREPLALVWPVSQTERNGGGAGYCPRVRYAYSARRLSP